MARLSRITREALRCGMPKLAEELSGLIRSRRRARDNRIFKHLHDQFRIFPMRCRDS
jgi:hypothetical protein